MLSRLIRAFLRNQRGTVSIVSALALPALVGFGALVAEYGNGLITKTQNQRIADLAAYAGGRAYLQTNSTTSMTAAAQSVAAMNGIPASQLTVSLVTSPRTATNKAVQATIATTKTLLLAPVLGAGRSLSVTTTAQAEIASQSSSCILALSGAGTGITLSGGTKITAPGCSVNSNNTISVPCGTTISAKAVTYNSAAVPDQPCSGITTTSLTKVLTADPLANNTGVQTATARVATVAAMSAPTMTAVTGGGNIDFAYNQSSTQSQAIADGCTATMSGNTWTLTCPSGGSYKFGNITLGGGITLNFNTGGSASTTYSFSGSISNSGTAITFGPGTYNITQGVTTGGGSTTTFGAGTFNIGRSTSGCSGGGQYSVCNTSTLTFGGPSTFVLTAGLYNSGGSTLTFGSGTTNSFNIGASSDGNAFYLGGGSKTVLADATGGSSLFRVVGNVNVVSGGGSCLTLSAAAQHDINGFFSTAGGTFLGAGVYTVNSYIALGANGGGDVTCNGTNVGVSGTGVTLVAGASSTYLSGTCQSAGFCVASGYNNVTLTAPTSGATANLVVVGPTSAYNTAKAIFAEGASNTSLSGAFYFPNGAVGLSGGATVGGGTGQCLQLIGSQVTLSGGTAAASNCFGGSGGNSSVALVQ